MEFKYMYSFNRERYQEIYKKELRHRDSVDAIEYKEGTILPAIPQEGTLFGVGGGIR